MLIHPPLTGRLLSRAHSFRRAYSEFPVVSVSSDKYLCRLFRSSADKSDGNNLRALRFMDCK